MNMSVWATRERVSETDGRLAKRGGLALPRSGRLADYHQVEMLDVWYRGTSPRRTPPPLGLP